MPGQFAGVVPRIPEDLENKLIEFQHYYNGHRAHTGLRGRLPDPLEAEPSSPMNFDCYRWQKHLSRVVPDSHRRMIYEFAMNRIGAVK
jgi:hypothetical protein